MADPRDNPRPSYPPPDDPNQTGYYGPQHSPQRPAGRDERSNYPPPDPSRQGQYPPDPRAGHTYPPPPPGQWPGPQHGGYPQQHHYPDPQQAHYSYPPPPPRQEMGQPPQPMQPDAYRLPPPYPPPGYYPTHYQPPPAPAPRQRTAIACKYCRKRKIRCSGYDSSPDGRCQNCVRFNQQCLFHPVSSQAAFVPASAVYGPNARAPIANQGPDGRPPQNGQTYPREGEQQPMLYGAHGQPLGPAGPQGHPQYNYPPPQNYPYQYPGNQYPPPPGSQYESQGQAPQQHGERVSLKRPLPDDDNSPNEDSHTSQSPHPNSKPRQGAYESRGNSSGSYDYPDPTSPASTNMSYQSYPLQHRYTNGSQSQKGGNSPPAGLTPQSAHGYNSPHSGPARDEGRTPPPNQPGSAGSSTNGRSGMKVHEMLGNPNPHGGAPAEQRGRSDNEMLNKLDGKKERS